MHVGKMSAPRFLIAYGDMTGTARRRGAVVSMIKVPWIAATVVTLIAPFVMSVEMALLKVQLSRMITSVPSLRVTSLLVMPMTVLMNTVMMKPALHATSEPLDEKYA